MENNKKVRREYWQKHINAFKDSGMSKAAYSREHQLNYHQLLYWYDRFNKKANTLVPIQVHNSALPKHSALCTVELASGHRLTLHDESLIANLKQLIQALS